MKKRLFGLIILVLIVLAVPASALAQTYYFSLDEEVVHVFWNEDGTLSLDYVFTFTNSTSASPIDYVDVGAPNNNYDLHSVSADVNGIPAYDITSSPYVENGVTVGLGANAIQPGQTGKVHVYFSQIRGVLYEDSEDPNYASAVFSPTWFGEEYLYGSTHMTVIFHLPPGVQPGEPKWHASPRGWPSEPVASHDEQGRIVYMWENAQANGYTQYTFGASFPKQYVPASAITLPPPPSIWETIGVNPEDLLGGAICLGFFAFFFGSIALSIYTTRSRQMKYLPPKISIEGHGVKRGLTAVEAAVLMEQPMDKVLTMILFSVLKKGAAEVVSREPLNIKISDPLPEGLRTYEVEFLQAFALDNNKARRKALQDLMVNLVKSLSEKMKGFSRKETVAYYESIMRKAWAEVEAAATPEIKSEKYDEAMEWTMLDRNYDDRTREVFRSGPVYVPTWWWRFDPDISRRSSGGRVPGHPSATPTTVQPSSGGGKGLSMPVLPGADFAASVVGGVQNFASGVVGNVSEFTSAITNKTNPIPKSSSSGRGWSGGGGGHSCACACACAGCACACAGGGR